MKYRLADREKQLVFGLYPEVTLDTARKLRDEARQHLRDFQDLAVEKRKRKLAVSAAAMETFEKLARTWHALGAGACSGRDLQP